MKLKELEDEIDQIVEEESHRPFFKDWINDAILQVAAEIDLPALKLLEPETLSVDNTAWIWEMPSTFHRKLFRCNFLDSSQQTHRVTVYDRRDDLEYKDHTRQQDAITSVATAVQGSRNYLLIDPLPVSEIDLNLWFYRKPTVLDDPNDSCDCIPPEFHYQVIVPTVIIRNYQKLLDQVVSSDLKPLSYWQGEYSKGIYGGPMIGPGLKNYLIGNERPPRRTGGRDPVGRGSWRHGR